MSEQDPLIATVGSSSSERDPGPGFKENLTWRARTAKQLESQFVHRIVVALIIIDSLCVIVDLGYTLLTSESDCTPGGPGNKRDSEAPEWLEILSKLSLAITTLFLVEIPLQLWAFGIRYFNPIAGPGRDERGGKAERERVMYGGLHLFDAIVIMTTFVLEVVLKGKERELAGLLVLLRLWRLVKLVGGVVVGVRDIGEEEAQDLADVRRELVIMKVALDEALAENRFLRQRLGSDVP